MDWWIQVLGSANPDDKIGLHLWAADGTDLKVWVTRDIARQAGEGLIKLAGPEN